MKLLLVLFGSEFKSLGRWFTTNKLSKFSVLIGFFIVLAIIELFIYNSSHLLFANLLSHARYGLITTNYIFNSSLTLLLLVMLISSFSVTLFQLLHPTQEISHLLSLPLSPQLLNLFISLKTAFTSSLFLFIGLAPMILAFYRNSNLSSDSSYMLSIGLVSLALTLLTQAFGSMLAFLLADSIRKWNVWINFFAISTLLFIISKFSIGLIIPTQLKTLYAAPIEQFDSIFFSLPLNNSLWPTFHLSQALTGQLTFGTVVIAIVSFAVFFIAFFLQSQDLPYLLADIFSKPSRIRSKPSILTRSHLPLTTLLIRDLQSFFRNSGEVAYSLFLLSMSMLFFLLIGQSKINSQIFFQWQNWFTAASFIWLLFFATAYSLRLIYPQAAKEKTTAWHLFTLPVSTKLIFHAKIIYSLLIVSPLLLAAIFVWHILPFQLPQVLLVTRLSLVSLISLILTQLFIGSIKPEFSQSTHPEKASTSLSGLVAITLSFIIMGLATYLLFHLSQPVVIFYCLTTILWLTFLYFLAHRSIRRYQF